MGIAGCRLPTISVAPRARDAPSGKQWVVSTRPAPAAPKRLGKQWGIARWLLGCKSQHEAGSTSGLRLCRGSTGPWQREWLLNPLLYLPDLLEVWEGEKQ